MQKSSPRRLSIVKGASSKGQYPSAGPQTDWPGPAMADEEEEELPGIDELDSYPPPPAVEGPSGRRYGETSLAGLAVSDEPRKRCIKLVERPIFDAFILLTILCNCVTMAWESPLDPEGTWKAGFIDLCEW